MYITEIPDLNSEQFVKWPSELSNKYHSAEFGTDLFQRCIPLFQRHNNFLDQSCPQYFQLKQWDDKFSWQIAVSDFFDVSFEWRDFKGGVIPATFTTSSGTLAGDTYNANGTISPIPLTRYQFTFNVGDDLSGVEGYYFLVCKLNYTNDDFETFISEPYWIKETHSDTVLIEYNHSVNNYDVMFSLAPIFSLRISGYKDYSTNTLETTKFRNQDTNLRQLYARDWVVFSLKLGKTMYPYGISPYHCNKVAKIQKCDIVYIDGVRMIMEEGADFEPQMYGENYPMRTLDIKFANYYSNQSIAAITSSRVEIFTSGDDVGYPYAFNTLFCIKIAGTTSSPIFAEFLSVYPPNNIRVVFDSADEDTFIDELNANALAQGFEGTFSKDAGVIYYNCAGDEAYQFTTLRPIFGTIIDFERTGATTNAITFRFDAISVDVNVVIAVYDSLGGIIDAPTTFSSSAGVNIYPTTSGTGAAKMYVITNGLVNGMYIDGGGTPKCITKISNVVSPLLQGIEVRNCTFTDTEFKIDFLSNAKQAIHGINVVSCNITGIDMAGFVVSTTGDFSQLVYVGFDYQNLDTAAQNTFYNGFASTVFAAGYSTVFTLATRFQTPPSSPDAGSSTARVLMLTAGNTILF